MDVIVSNRSVAFPADMVLAFENTKLRWPGNRTADVAKVFGFGKWSSDMEDRALMSEYAATKFIGVIGVRKVLNEGPVRAVLDLPARLAYRLNTARRVYLGEPLSEDIWLIVFLAHGLTLAG